MALPGFYNQGDQDIYASGDKFIPQEQYRLGYTAPPSIANASTGITNTQAASPYIWPPRGGGGGGGGDFKGGIDKYPHLDTTKTKDFYEKVWTGNKWETQHVPGFYDTVTGNWKTKDNKNIQHAGLEVPGIITGFLNKISGKKFGEPQVGDIKGTFTPEGEETEEEKLHKIAVMQKIKEKAYSIPQVGPRATDGADTTDITTTGINKTASGAEAWTPTGEGNTTPGIGWNETGGPVSNKTGKGRTDWFQGGRIGLYGGGGAEDYPENESENIFEIMQDQNIPFSEQVEAGPTEEQVAMVIDMDGRGMEIDEISSITQLGKETIMSILGVEMAQGGIARLL